MEQFVTLERAIACPQASVASAAGTAAHVLGQAGYRRGLGFGPTASYVRSRRPNWALVVAIVAALPTIGLSLLLLLVRTKDHCNVVIEDGPYGVVALVSGRVPASLPAHLEGSVGQRNPTQQVHGHSPQMPPPMVLSPSGSINHQEPAFSPQAILRPATPVPALPALQEPPASPFPPEGSPFPVASGRPAPAPAWAESPPPPAWAEVPASVGLVEPSAHQPEPGSAQPGQQPEPADPPVAAEPLPPPVAFRPPSRLGPQQPVEPSPPARNGSGVNGSGLNGAGTNAEGVNGAGANGSAVNASTEDDDPSASSSGRVPWAVSGVRQPGPASAPSPFPVPVSAAPSLPSAPDSSGAAALTRPASGAVATADGGPTQVLRVDTGEALPVGLFCLLGREPASRDGDPPATLVRLEDAKLSVSKTHLAYGVDEQGLWVIDRNSTNGTTVIDPSGRRIPCAAGARHHVPVGSQIQIGQRKLMVERADGAAEAT